MDFENPKNDHESDDHDDDSLEHSHSHDAAHGEGGHGEPWLVSYADLMTLLFGFFVLMYTFASADESTKQKIKQSVSEYAGGEYVTQFREVAEFLSSKIKEIQLDGEVKVDETLDGVRIISKGTLFFESGSTALKPQAEQLMLEIATILHNKASDYIIWVEGHTDDNPISTPLIPSNWELSSLRAGTVVRIFEKMGLDRKNLRPLGLSDTEPLLPNRDSSGNPIPANQAENRRIVISIKKEPNKG